MCCPQTLQLLTQYSKALNDYSVALSAKLKYMRTVSRFDYKVLQRAAKEALHVADEARDRLAQHRAEHRC